MLLPHSTATAHPLQAMPAGTAAAAATARLRHPGTQHDVQPPRSVQQGREANLDAQSQRVVSLLLKELSAARKQEAAAAAELAQLKGDLAAASRRGDRERRRDSSGGGRGIAAAGGRIPAFRPASQAPPPRQGKARPLASLAEPPPAAPTNRAGSQGEAEALQQDNAELRSQVEALYAHCRHLQRQLGAGNAAAKPPASSSSAGARIAVDGLTGQAAVAAHVCAPQREHQQQPARAASPQRAQRAQHAGERDGGSTLLAAVVCSSPRRARSPARVNAAIVSSPATGGAVEELAMAVFEASAVWAVAG